MIIRILDEDDTLIISNEGLGWGYVGPGSSGLITLKIELSKESREEDGDTPSFTASIRELKAAIETFEKISKGDE